MDLSNLTAFSLENVTLTDAYFLNALEKDVAYLVSFDTDKLLAGFRETAGIDMHGATRYSGWETSLIGGHTIGHYMIACLHAYESPDVSVQDKKKLYEILSALVTGLKECQDAVGTGFLFGATLADEENIEKQFDNVENNRTNITTEAWVPWYTMHKIMEGLVAVAGMEEPETDGVTTNETTQANEIRRLKEEALTVASDLGDWVYGRTSSWSEATRNTVLSIEYGGMNDCMYDLYLLTGKSEHLQAAHAFDQTTLFEAVYNAQSGDDILNNRHANTTIPKFMGALKRYVVTGEEEYLDYAVKFWTLVTEDHTYITGGNSEWEHFGQDDVLDNERTNCNCETCNAYNMLKMTKLLFQITGDVKYADWYENTFLNSVMSSQNPETGMTTYFQPMASGYFKVYGEEFNKFWCCTGTGMENFTKLGESFYFYKEDTLVVNQYISSVLNWEEKNVIITQKTSIPEEDTAIFTVDNDFDGTICFRLPDWLASEAVISVNGLKINYDVTGAKDGSNGYAVLKGGFMSGDEISVTLPMTVRAYALPDGENTYGFKYGPVVLSALLGTEDMFTTTTGVNVTIPGEKYFSAELLPSESEKITILSGSTEEFMQNIADNLVRDKNAEKLTFTLKNTDANLTYVTHYKQHSERYGIYFKFSDDQAELNMQNYVKELKIARLEAFRIDTVQPGYGQYENDELHSMTETGEGSTGKTDGGTRRVANANGSFSYTMLVNKEGTDLLATFDAEDDGKGIRITAGEDVVCEMKLNSGDETGTYEVAIPVPEEVIKNNVKTVLVDGTERDAVTFTFEGLEGEASASLCDFLYTMDHMSDECNIEKISVNTGKLYYSPSKQRYVLAVDENITEVQISLEIPGQYSYVMLDENVVNHNEQIQLAVSEQSYTAYKIAVYAENHQDVTYYDFVIKKGELDFSDEEIENQTVVYALDCGDHGVNTTTGNETASGGILRCKK